MKRVERFTPEERHTITEALRVARGTYFIDAGFHEGVRPRLEASFKEEAKRCDVLIQEFEL